MSTNPSDHPHTVVNRHYQWIQTPADWSACLEHLGTVSRLALDVEANSLFAYRERVCLLQISTQAHDYVIDPLAGLNLEPLGALIGDPAVEKVLHAAEYDLILMTREYGWELRNLFDTMWAARILGMERVGLASLLEELFGVKLDKRHQRADWSKRPLTVEQLQYAQADTFYLLRLRDYLGEALKRGGLEEESAEIFAAQCQIKLPDNGFVADSFWSIPGVNQLTPQQQAILRELYLMRDQEASRQDRPPFKILGNAALMALAAHAPARWEELKLMPGLNEHLKQRYGALILRAVQAGRQAAPPRRPRPPTRPPEEVYLRYEKLFQWRKTTAHARGVNSDVIISRELLWEIAYANPQSPADLAGIRGLGPWQRQTYGPAWLQLLSQSPTNSRPAGRRRHRATNEPEGEQA